MAQYNSPPQDLDPSHLLRGISLDTENEVAEPAILRETDTSNIRVLPNRTDMATETATKIGGEESRYSAYHIRDGSHEDKIEGKECSENASIRSFNGNRNQEEDEVRHNKNI